MNPLGCMRLKIILNIISQYVGMAQLAFSAVHLPKESDTSFVAQLTSLVHALARWQPDGGPQLLQAVSCDVGGVNSKQQLSPAKQGFCRKNNLTDSFIIRLEAYSRNS